MPLKIRNWEKMVAEIGPFGSWKPGTDFMVCDNCHEGYRGSPGSMVCLTCEVRSMRKRLEDQTGISTEDRTESRS